MRIGTEEERAGARGAEHIRAATMVRSKDRFDSARTGQRVRVRAPERRRVSPGVTRAARYAPMCAALSRRRLPDTSRLNALLLATFIAAVTLLMALPRLMLMPYAAADAAAAYAIAAMFDTLMSLS